MANTYEKKIDKLEKIKQQIKEEEKKIEQDLGRIFLKTFNLNHSDIEEAKELIKTLGTDYTEKENKEVNESESNTAYNEQG